MYVIKNRITGEYDRRGMDMKFHKVERSAWNKLSHAKSHVCQKLRYFHTTSDMYQWYMNADFIEMTDDGIGERIPVSDYLNELK